MNMFEEMWEERFVGGMCDKAMLLNFDAQCICGTCKVQSDYGNACLRSLLLCFR